MSEPRACAGAGSAVTPHTVDEAIPVDVRRLKIPHHDATDPVSLGEHSSAGHRYYALERLILGESNDARGSLAQAPAAESAVAVARNSPRDLMLDLARWRGWETSSKRGCLAVILFARIDGDGSGSRDQSNDNGA